MSVKLGVKEFARKMSVMALKAEGDDEVEEEQGAEVGRLSSLSNAAVDMSGFSLSLRRNSKRREMREDRRLRKNREVRTSRKTRR